MNQQNISNKQNEDFDKLESLLEEEVQAQKKVFDFTINSQQQDNIFEYAVENLDSQRCHPNENVS